MDTPIMVESGKESDEETHGNQENLPDVHPVKDVPAMDPVSPQSDPLGEHACENGFKEESKEESPVSTVEKTEEENACNTVEKQQPEDDSSNASSPDHSEPFCQRFSIKFTDDITKDGDVVKYTIQVRKLAEDIQVTVKRQFEDFEYLDHCLCTGNKIDGVIVPPLPPRPPIDPQAAEEMTKKKLGSSSRAFLGDQFQKDSKMLEKYLEQLMTHPVFGSDPQLENFLMKPEPPARAKVKKGLWSRFTDSLDARKATHPDCDEFFQRQREWAISYGHAIKDGSDKFESLLASEQRLGGQLRHLATALSLAIQPIEGANATYNRLNSKFAESLENLRESFEASCGNGSETLGFTLDLYSRCLESLLHMLLRRTCLLVDYENANKALEKVKTNRREPAEAAKYEAERSFEECSDVAREEIKRFHRVRSTELKTAIGQYAETQVKLARDTYAMVTQALASFSQLPIHFPSQNSS